MESQANQNHANQNQINQESDTSELTISDRNNSDLSNSDLSNSDLNKAIDKFKVYLNNQKKKNHTYFHLTESSQVLMEQWAMPSEALMPGSDSSQAASFYCEGPESSNVFIIDSHGGFFKDESGQLLVKILKAMNITSESAYICNAENLSLIKEKVIKNSPRILIALGTKAAQLLLNSHHSIHEIRGKLFMFQGIKVMPTYHPSRLLEKPGLKRQVWEDMKIVMETIGLNNGA